MYAPVTEAQAAVSRIVLPGEYPVSMFCSEKYITKGRDGVGTNFKAMVFIDGGQSTTFEDFLVPNDDADLEVMQNRVSKRTGEVYEDFNYDRYVRLFGVAGGKHEKGADLTNDDILEIFENVGRENVYWYINVEMVANSRDKHNNPVENWDEIVEWFAKHAGDSARTIKHDDGKMTIRWTVYKNTPELELSIREAENVKNIFVTNRLGSGKPKKRKPRR